MHLYQALKWSGDEYGCIWQYNFQALLSGLALCQLNHNAIENLALY